MAGKFLSPLVMVDIEDGRNVRLLAPLHYRSEVIKGLVIAPRGFETDFASIPRGLWNLFPKFGKWNRAAVIHDAAYRGRLLSRGGRMTVVRGLADRLFLEALAACGVGPVKRRLMFWGVRSFGWTAYKGTPRGN